MGDQQQKEADGIASPYPQFQLPAANRGPKIVNEEV